MEISVKSFVLWWSMLIIVNGFYIKDDNSSSEEIHNENLDFTNILKSWSNFKSKLQLANNLDKTSSEENHSNESNNEESFNEVEVLQMIPSIIDQYRAKKLTTNDQLILSEIYGNLWSIICQEADRPTDDEINPMLKSLLQSFHFTGGTDSLTTNDIHGNSIKQMRKAAAAAAVTTNKLLLNINKEDHPSQRVLNTAAMLIHQVMNSRDSSKKQSSTSDSPSSSAKQSKLHSRSGHKTKHSKKMPRTATLNLQLTNIPITQITRSKRNVQIRVSGEDLPATKIDALLKIFRDNHGLNSNEIDDDGDDDDEDYDENEHHLKLNSGSKDKDYWYDDLYEDDEEAASTRSQDPDYGSFQDLILLATKHRLTREQEERHVNKPKNGRQFLSD